MNQRNRRVVAVGIMLVVSMLLGVIASGNGEREYVLFGAHSTDKKANIKTLTILYYEYLDLIASLEDQVLDQYGVAVAAYEAGEEEIVQQEPDIWETDEMFSERIAAELAEHIEATEMAWEKQILALFATIETEMDEIEKLADVTSEHLASPKIVTVSDVRFGEYQRNDRLWPVQFVFSDDLLVDICIDAVVDFAPELMEEYRVRKAIVDFDQAVKEESLRWQLSYYIRPIEFSSDDEFLLSPEFLVLLDTLMVLDSNGVVLYQQSLQAPAPLAIFTMTRELELEQTTLHPSFSVSDFPSQFRNRYYPRMRNLGLPILLTYPEMDTTAEYEADRLSAFAEPVAPPVVPKAPPAVEEVVFRISNGAEPE
ncbi:MAG TPA: hypothetical protein VFC80_02480, partial [Sphaerochaeta sp.]|nr:hypothetical protein [Sphaerochaeta sp.]